MLPESAQLLCLWLLTSLAAGSEVTLKTELQEAGVWNAEVDLVIGKKPWASQRKLAVLLTLSEALLVTFVMLQCYSSVQQGQVTMQARRLAEGEEDEIEEEDPCEGPSTQETQEDEPKKEKKKKTLKGSLSRLFKKPKKRPELPELSAQNKDEALAKIRQDLENIKAELITRDHNVHKNLQAKFQQLQVEATNFDLRAYEKQLKRCTTRQARILEEEDIFLKFDLIQDNLEAIKQMLIGDFKAKIALQEEERQKIFEEIKEGIKMEEPKKKKKDKKPE